MVSEKVYDIIGSGIAAVSLLAGTFYTLCSDPLSLIYPAAVSSNTIATPLINEATSNVLKETQSNEIEVGSSAVVSAMVFKGGSNAVGKIMQAATDMKTSEDLMKIYTYLQTATLLSKVNPAITRLANYLGSVLYLCPRLIYVLITVILGTLSVISSIFTVYKILKSITNRKENEKIFISPKPKRRRTRRQSW